MTDEQGRLSSLAIGFRLKTARDKRGLKVIKKIRCNVNPADPECTTKSEEDWK